MTPGRMFTLLARLDGRYVRLEPLQPGHAADLAAAAEYIEAALAQRDAGTAAPFAVVRIADGAAIGSTRFFDLVRWPWPPGHPRHGIAAPDVCEIGYTW